VDNSRITDKILHVEEKSLSDVVVKFVTMIHREKKTKERMNRRSPCSSARLGRERVGSK
jgi:hypothetical protein